MCVCVGVHMSASYLQKKALEPLELALQAT